MKTLNNYINEWRANTNTVSSIKKPQYFIYEIHKLQQIKIHAELWSGAELLYSHTFSKNLFGKC